MKRSRLVQMSANRKASLPTRRAVKAEVFERDGWVCRQQSSECGGPLTPGHLRKEAQGGKYVPTNLIAQCAVHNDAVEDDPDVAHALGLVQRAGDTIEEVWARLYAAGLSSSPVPGSPP